MPLVRPNNKLFIILSGGFVLIVMYWLTSANHPENPNARLISLPELLSQAIHAAEAGGNLVLSTKDQLEIKNKGKTAEGVNDPVTTADFLSHCAMLNVLKNGGLPPVKIISEETDVKCQDFSNMFHKLNKGDNLDLHKDDYVALDDVTIWIDPLDATKEYTEKLYQYVTTMVCVAVKGQPVIGVIHSPFNGTTSWGWVGHGYSPDLESKQPVIDKTRTLKIIVSRSHSGTIKEVLHQNLKNFELFVAAGAGYKVLQVVKGKADAYLHSTVIKKWDICAGNAILNALGGKMTTKSGEDLDYSSNMNVVNKNGLIAALPHNHGLFLNKF